MRRKLCVILYDKDPKATVVLWELKAEAPRGSLTEKCFSLYHLIKVPKKDLGMEGKYRAICKLIIQGQNGIICCGTGFLINNRTVVTAAHNVCDDYATSIEVHVGYCEGNHVQHETRWGKHVAINLGYHNYKDHVYDFAVIRLNKPFNKVREYIQCRSSSTEHPEIAVVGYPQDPQQNKDGQHMHISKGPKGRVEDHVLRYKLDTTAGNSGSPVLEVRGGKSLRAIGVHFGGLFDDKSNYAAMINQMGNDVTAFTDSFKIRESGGGRPIDGTETPKLWKISPPIKTSATIEKGHRKKDNPKTR
ncbi:hypothetical protein ABKA04_002807 [Annulohypoxylon sp. FPYF3050]